MEWRLDICAVRLARGAGAQWIAPCAGSNRVDAEGARALCEDGQRAAGDGEVLEEVHELDLLFVRGGEPEVVEHERHGNEEDQQGDRSPARLEPEDDTDAAHKLQNGRDRRRCPEAIACVQDPYRSVDAP